MAAGGARRGLCAGLDGLALRPAPVEARRPVKPQAWLQGLNLLLNEQTDKTIDAFIGRCSMIRTPAGLHFALGSLFRRRGEFRAGGAGAPAPAAAQRRPPPIDRQRTPACAGARFHEGRAVRPRRGGLPRPAGSTFDTEARLALLGLYERSRDWRGRRSGRAARTPRYRQLCRPHCTLSLQACPGGRRARRCRRPRRSTRR